MIVIDTRRGAQRFRDWYIPHVEELNRQWKMNHPDAHIPDIDDYLMTGDAP